MADTQANPKSPIKVTAAELPLCCPTPSMELWNQHPRVYLDLSKTGQAKCPYCGYEFILEGDAGAHH